MLSRILLLLCAICALTVLAGCPPKPKTDEKPAARPAAEAPVKSLTLWADPALRGALDALKPLALQRGLRWDVSYVERGRLLEIAAGKALTEGTPRSAVFSSAPDGLPAPQALLISDEKVYEALRSGGLIDESSARSFAGDLLAVVSLKAKPWPAPSLYDLPLLGFELCGAGGVNTSVGQYGQQALVSSGVDKLLGERTKFYESLDALMAALKGGEVQVALTFASAAAQDPELEVSATVEEDLHEDVRYQALAVKGRERDAAVRALLKLLAEDAEAQRMLEAYGYLGREAALVEQK
jgi:hypothetical protein